MTGEIELSCAPMTDVAKVRTGVIGLGIMGAAHARKILAGSIPELQLAAVCDADSERIANWERETGIPGYTALDDLLQSGIEAVVIATPHFSHVEVGIKTLDAGLHALVEKPIAVETLEAQRLIDAHRNPRQVFAAMFNQRADPLYAELKRILASGEMGSVHRISWTVTDWFRTQAYYDMGGWRATWRGEGGGVLINQCPHQLDLYQWLFGQPTEVRAVCQFGRFHEIEVEDSVTALLTHADGAIGTFCTTTGEAPGTNRLEIAADGGKIVAEDGKLTITRNTLASSDFIRTASEPFAKPASETTRFEPVSNGDQHLHILRNFGAACARGEPLIAPASEGIRSLELANAMILSSVQNATVSLPIDRAAYSRWLEQKISESAASDGMKMRKRPSAAR